MKIPPAISHDPLLRLAYETGWRSVHDRVDLTDYDLTLFDDNFYAKTYEKNALAYASGKKPDRAVTIYLLAQHALMEMPSDGVQKIFGKDVATLNEEMKILLKRQHGNTEFAIAAINFSKRAQDAIRIIGQNDGQASEAYHKFWSDKGAQPRDEKARSFIPRNVRPN